MEQTTLSSCTDHFSASGTALVGGNRISISHTQDRTLPLARALASKVTVTNHGASAEVINLTIYLNTTSLASQTVELTSASCTTISFLWNTTDWNKGDYSLGAYAIPVLGEVFTFDNSLVYSVYIGTPGDVDGNRIVSMLDLYYIALSFGKTTPYSPYEVANYDIEDNGIINMLDVYIAALHFGQTEP